MCEPTGGGSHAGATNREEETIVVVICEAKLRRIVPEAEPETARAGTCAILLTPGHWLATFYGWAIACMPCVYPVVSEIFLGGLWGLFGTVPIVSPTLCSFSKSFT
jgi:hypothetical protein